MEIKYAIIGILSLIGVVVLISWLSAIYSRKVKEDAKDLSESWPPLKYMDVIGSKCPDYWQFVGTRETPSTAGKKPIVYNICKNIL